MHAFVNRLANATALLGGAVIVFIIALTCLSILGRELFSLGHSPDGWLGTLILWLGINEIKGSYEVAEAGVAFAIFCFLPICQFRGQHATVDVFTASMHPGRLRVLKAFWEVVFSAAVLFITFGIYGGLQRYFANGETTFFLQFPVWWAYAAALCASVIAGFVAVYCAWARVSEAWLGRPILPEH